MGSQPRQLMAVMSSLQARQSESLRLGLDGVIKRPLGDRMVVPEELRRCISVVGYSEILDAAGQSLNVFDPVALRGQLLRWRFVGFVVVTFRAKQMAEEFPQEGQGLVQRPEVPGEFERRVETLVDPETDRIRTAVQPVSGIGPELSLAIAREFGSLEELRAADREQLEAVNGIGDGRADAIRERVETHAQ